MCCSSSIRIGWCALALASLQEAFGWKGVRLDVLDPPKQLEPAEELVRDLLTIVTVFAGRLYGHRAKGIRKRVQVALQACATAEQGREDLHGTGQKDYQTPP
jgi:predicted site-specific integrase-resolvase